MDEADLLEQWQLGDADAGQNLVARHFAMIRRFFSNKANEDLEDLVQETFTRGLAKRGALRQSSSFRAFILGVARNVLFEYYRARTRRRGIDFGTTSLEAIDTSISGKIGVAQERTRINTALRQLPLEYQISIELRYWENTPVSEIAEITGVPVGTVKSRLSAARKQLRRHLEALTGPTSPPTSVPAQS